MTVYVVPWIDKKHGSPDKHGGYQIFKHLGDCRRVSREQQANGYHTSGYWGPDFPLRYFKVKYKTLPETVRRAINYHGKLIVGPEWTPVKPSDEKQIPCGSSKRSTVLSLT